MTFFVRPNGSGFHFTLFLFFLRRSWKDSEGNSYFFGMTRSIRIAARGSWLILWMGLIFFFSHQPGTGVNWEPPFWYVVERKSAHVFEYAVLTFLTFRFFWLVYLKETFGKVLILAAVFSLMYGATDELHQFFIFGRGAHLQDVLVDVLGIAGMSFLLILLWRAKMRA